MELSLAPGELVQPAILPRERSERPLMQMKVAVEIFTILTSGMGSFTERHSSTTSSSSSEFSSESSSED